MLKIQTEAGAEDLWKKKQTFFRNRLQIQCKKFQNEKNLILENLL